VVLCRIGIKGAKKTPTEQKNISNYFEDAYPWNFTHDFCFSSKVLTKVA